MKVVNNGAFIRVVAGSNEVLAFRGQWPCSGLPDRSLWAEFQTSNGDLVDMKTGFDEAAGVDGGAISALVEDMKQYAKKELNLGHW